MSLVAAVIRKEESEWAVQNAGGHCPHHLVIGEPWVDSPAGARIPTPIPRPHTGESPSACLLLQVIPLEVAVMLNTGRHGFEDKHGDGYLSS